MGSKVPDHLRPRDGHDTTDGLQRRLAHALLYISVLKVVPTNLHLARQLRAVELPRAVPAASPVVPQVQLRAGNHDAERPVRVVHADSGIGHIVRFQILLQSGLGWEGKQHWCHGNSILSRARPAKPSDQRRTHLQSRLQRRLQGGLVRVRLEPLGKGRSRGARRPRQVVDAPHDARAVGTREVPENRRERRVQLPRLSWVQPQNYCSSLTRRPRSAWRSLPLPCRAGADREGTQKKR
eukprot:scaffold286_cov247-Pinguiococcus_pyrenoidosus.AAC.14